MKNKVKARIKKIFENERSRKKFIFIFVLSSTFLWLFWGIPLPTKLSSKQFPVSTKLFDRNGKLIYEIYTEEKRTPIKLEDIPDYAEQATIAIEDKDFYKHSGFSLTGVVRATYNIISGCS